MDTQPLGQQFRPPVLPASSFPFRIFLNPSQTVPAAPGETPWPSQEPPAPDPDLPRPEPAMIPILLYHSVSDHPVRSMRRCAVPTASFQRHCRILAASGRTPMTVSAFADGLRSAALPPDPVVVTIDDGFSDTFAAASRLADAGLPSTVYITTSWVGRPWMLNECDLRRLTTLGVEIGGHGHTHRRLDELGDQELAAELTVCRRSLAATTGTEVTSFSYPHGSHDQRTRRAAAAAGYRSACSTRNAGTHPTDDVFALARLTVTADVTDACLTAWLDGQSRRAPRGEPLPNRVWRHVRRAHTGLRHQGQRRRDCAFPPEAARSWLPPEAARSWLPPEAARSWLPPKAARSFFLAPPEAGCDMVAPPEAGCDMVAPPEAGCDMVAPPEAGCDTVAPPEAGCDTVAPPEAKIPDRCAEVTATLRTGPSSRPGAWSTGAGCRPGGSSRSWTA